MPHFTDETKTNRYVWWYKTGLLNMFHIRKIGKVQNVAKGNQQQAKREEKEAKARRGPKREPKKRERSEKGGKKDPKESKS